jgi:hypothetical protein
VNAQEIDLSHFHFMLIQTHVDRNAGDKTEKALLFAPSDP